MSYKKLIIDADDESKYQSLVDGSNVPDSVHTHTIRATSRTVTASDDIELTDENNIIDVSDARTATVSLGKSLIAATPNLQFKVRVEYNASYNAQVQFNNTQFWILTGNPVSPITYAFSIDASGLCIPENDGLSLTPPA